MIPMDIGGRIVPMHRWIGEAIRACHASVLADGGTATRTEVRTSRDWRSAWLDEHVAPHGYPQWPVTMPWSVYSGVVACIPEASHRAGWMRFHGFTTSLPGT